MREGLIDVDHSLQIGIRTIAPKTCGLNIIDAYRCHEIGTSGMVDAIRARVGAKPAYLTLDIDVLDPAFAPGTGTPEYGGLTAIQGLEIVRGCRGLQLVGSDVVEVAPQYDSTTNTRSFSSRIAIGARNILLSAIVSSACRGTSTDRL
mgnify:CR=1 FL=1